MSSITTLHLPVFIYGVLNVVLLILSLVPELFPKATVGLPSFHENFLSHFFLTSIEWFSGYEWDQGDCIRIELYMSGQSDIQQLYRECAMHTLIYTYGHQDQSFYPAHLCTRVRSIDIIGKEHLLVINNFSSNPTIIKELHSRDSAAYVE